MKIKACSKRYFLQIFIGCQLLAVTSSNAQICQHPLDSVYSMNTGGVIYPLNVNNALTGTAIPASSATGTASSNGLGFSILDGKFYYFNKVGTGAAPSPQFVSYDPVTTTLTTLPSPPATITSSQKIRTGCVNNLGSGYYTINPIFNPTTPALYYYNIATLTWTTITSSFVNPSSVSLNSTFNSLNSGDMAFDGAGNLWVLLSNTTNYALYKIAAPVPTTAVASVTATQIIGLTPVPTAGIAITGIAFNSAGTMFLTTGAGSDLLYKLVSVSAGLTLVGSITAGAGGDLTSCSAPLSVLPVSALSNFAAVLHNNGVELSWEGREDESIAGYDVEYSKDGEHWTSIGSVEKKYSSQATTNLYSFVQPQYAPDNNFYRIVQKSIDGKQIVSAVRLVNARNTHMIAIGPNPAKDILYINNTGDTNKYLARIFDRSGRMVYTTSIDQMQQSINISRLQKGNYILKLSSAVNNGTFSYQFIKW